MKLDAARPFGWLEVSFALLDLSDDQASDLGAEIEGARAKYEPDAFPLLTVRPTGEPSTALHVLFVDPDREGPRLDRLGSWAQSQAPDAERDVVLASVGPGLEGLRVVPRCCAMRWQATARPRTEP